MGRIAIVNEETLERISKKCEKPGKDVFNNNIRHFLNVLLSDPVHAEAPICVSNAGVSKQKLIDLMKKIGMLEYSERLDDKNKDGSFKDKVTMKVRYTLKDKVPDDEEYRVPKNKFDDNVEKLRIMVFERNVPDGVNDDILDDSIEECTSCSSVGTDGGQTLLQPITSEPVRRKGLYEMFKSDGGMMIPSREEVEAMIPENHKQKVRGDISNVLASLRDGVPYHVKTLALYFVYGGGVTGSEYEYYGKDADWVRRYINNEAYRTIACRITDEGMIKLEVYGSSGHVG